MRPFPLTALLIAMVSPFPALAAPADFGLKQGHPYAALEIDVELTRAKGGGKTTHPYLWLRQAPAQNPGWTETSVIATPQTGVCIVAGYVPDMQVSEADLGTVVNGLLTGQIAGLNSELGQHLLMRNGEFAAQFGIDDVMDEIENGGVAFFVSVAEKRPDVEASEVYIQLDGDTLSAAYRLSYPNAETCQDIIRQ